MRPQNGVCGSAINPSLSLSLYAIQLNQMGLWLTKGISNSLTWFDQKWSETILFDQKFDQQFRICHIDHIDKSSMFRSEWHNIDKSPLSFP